MPKANKKVVAKKVTKVAKPIKAVKAPKEKKQKVIVAKVEKTKAVEKKAVEVIAPKAVSKSAKASEFKVGEFAVYPSHGIGKIIDIQKTTVLGADFSCYLMHFEKENSRSKFQSKILRKSA